MPRVKTSRTRFRNVGELLAGLGDIPAWRVCLDPPPGTATSRDLIRARGTHGGACELIDRTIVEKPRDHLKAFLVAELVHHLGRYLDANDLGYLYGSGGWVRICPGLVRSPDLCFTPWSKVQGGRVPLAQIGQEAPELAVELPVDANTSSEIDRRVREYFAAGVRLVWVIHPREYTAEVYTAHDECVRLS